MRGHFLLTIKDKRLSILTKRMENVGTSGRKENQASRQEQCNSDEKTIPVKSGRKNETPFDTTLKAEDRHQTADSDGAFYKDIVAESYTLATRQTSYEGNANEKVSEGEREVKQGDADFPTLSKQKRDDQNQGKNFIQLESCGLHTIYSDRGHGNQQSEYIGESTATFLGHPQIWSHDPTFGQRVTHEERYAIPSDINPAYIQPQGVFVKTKPMQMQAVRQYPNEQMMQGSSNATLGYLRCVDQNMIIRPMEMRSYDGTQPILIEDDDALGGDENEVDENDGSGDGSSKKGTKKRKAKKPKIKRPMNAFMVWAKKNRPILAKNFPGMTNADISVMLGEKWSGMSPDQKQPYFGEADKIREQHKKDHPDWIYQPKPKRRRAGSAANSFFFEVTKNTQGGYITRHINELVLQQLPGLADQNGKQAMKAVPMIAGSPGVHYIQGQMMQSNDPSCSGNSFNGVNVVQPMCLGTMKYPGNVLTGGVLVAQPAHVPCFSAQGNVAAPISTAQRQCAPEEGPAVPRQAKQ